VALFSPLPGSIGGETLLFVFLDRKNSYPPDLPSLLLDRADQRFRGRLLRVLVVTGPGLATADIRDEIGDFGRAHVTLWQAAPGSDTTRQAEEFLDQGKYVLPIGSSKGAIPYCYPLHSAGSPDLFARF
jgi:hypothetical protein